MKMKKILAGTLICSMIVISCNKNNDTSTSSSSGMNGSNTDQDFMKTAAYGNFDEMDAGQLAASNGTDASVKDFGKMMLADHGKAETELSLLAKTKQIGLPNGPDQEHIETKQQLMKLSGRTFDSAYISAQVTDHKTTVDLFQNEISNGKDQDVKNFASKYLPAIKMHLAKADSIAKKFTSQQ